MNKERETGFLEECSLCTTIVAQSGNVIGYRLLLHVWLCLQISPIMLALNYPRIMHVDECLLLTYSLHTKTTLTHACQGAEFVRESKQTPLQKLRVCPTQHNLHDDCCLNLDNNQHALKKEIKTFLCSLYIYIYPLSIHAFHEFCFYQYRAKMEITSCKLKHI